MNTTYESVAVRLATEEGIPMAVGGICRFGAGAYWRERFLALKTLRMSGDDLYTIDYNLACAIQALAEDSLLIAGGTLNTMADLSLGESTGGVLGSPRETIGSSPNTSEKLPEGFSLYTVPGGPGLAALADEAATMRAAMAVKALGKNLSNAAILNCMRAEGIDTFLLVFDGSGPQAIGLLVAGSRGKTEAISLK